VRQLLSKPTIPIFQRIECLRLLGSTLGDYEEACSCCVQADTPRHITRRWYLEGADPVSEKALDDLHEGVNDLKYVPYSYKHTKDISWTYTLRQALIDEDEGRRESRLDLDTKVDVLDTLTVHDIGVGEDRALAEAEGETRSDEMCDGGEMSAEDMMSTVAWPVRRKWVT
jgi:hypothetical protein